jgi:hypothetical protein
MVTVLVPTGTPFSADRRSEAERHHFGHENNGGRGNITAAESPFPAYFAIKAVVFCSGRVERWWRVEVGIAAEAAEPKRERSAQRSDEAVRELEALPPGGDGRHQNR